jgi:hypothetical protein
VSEAWPTREEIAEVLDFDDFPSGVALELIEAQVAAREKAAAEKALRDAADAWEWITQAEIAEFEKARDVDGLDTPAEWLRVRADAGEGER